MFKERSECLLKKLEERVRKVNLTLEPIQAHPARLQHIYNRANEANLKKQSEVNTIYNDLLARVNAQIEERNRMNELVKIEEMALEAGRQEIEELKKKAIEPLAVSESLDEIKREIVQKKKTLAALKNLTGIRFDYNGPKDKITGYIILDHDGRKTVNPFMIDKDAKNIPKLLWSEVKKASDRTCVA